MELPVLAGLVGLLFVKEAGLPVPVPGDLLVIGAGAALAPNGAAALGVLGLILVAGYLGGTLQFALMRRAVRRLLLAMLERIGVSRERIEALGARLRRGGARGVAVARMTPGVRIGTIAACGLADLPTGIFVRGLVAGNTVFVAAHFGLGFVLGASAERLIGQVGGSLLTIVLGVAVLAGLGALGWAWLRRARLRTPSVAAAPYASWTDAACPACLALAVFEPREGRLGGG